MHAQGETELLLNYSDQTTKELFVILPTETDWLVPAFFSAQHWASPRADKLTFNFEQCHGEAFPQKGSLTKSCFLFSANCVVTLFIM